MYEWLLIAVVFSYNGDNIVTERFLKLQECKETANLVLQLDDSHRYQPNQKRWSCIKVRRR